MKEEIPLNEAILQTVIEQQRLIEEMRVVMRAVETFKLTCLHCAAVATSSIEKREVDVGNALLVMTAMAEAQSELFKAHERFVKGVL